jgi:phenylalanyl-tRNA synthetase beta subunit
LVPYSKDAKNQIKLENSQSSERNALRTNLYETLYPVVAEYKKQGIEEVGIFEIGKIYKEKENNYIETRVVEVIYENDQLPYEKSRKIKEIYYGLLKILGIPEVKTDLRYNSFTIKTNDLMNTSKQNLRVVEEYQNKIYEDVSISLNINKEFGQLYEKIKNLDKRIYKTTVIEEYFDPDKTKKSILIRLEFLEKEVSPSEATEIKNKIEDLVDSYKV